MTLDDEKSIYVGGLPYDATDETLRRVFELYGHIVAVKIINDREVGGKCYGFITFTNPRSAVNAIMDMNGRTIGGRVVRVNEVRTRGARPNLHRENFRRDGGRDNDWPRGRERERNNNRDRDHYRDRNEDPSHRDRERDYEHVREFDRARDHSLDRGKDHEDHDQESDHEGGWDRDWYHNLDEDESKYYDSGRDKDKEQPRTKLGGGRSNERESKELSSNSGDGYSDQIKEQLDKSIQKHEEIQKELSLIKDKVEDKQQLITDLQKKSQKLEDALAAAKNVSSQRHTMLTKLHRCFLQVQDYSERIKISEEELQSLVDAAMIEVDADDTANGQIALACAPSMQYLL